MNRFSYQQTDRCNAEESHNAIRVYIPSHDMIAGHAHYICRVFHAPSDKLWQVSRRYSEFFKLRQKLLELFARANRTCPGCDNFEKALQRFDFPKKHVFSSSSHQVIKYRKIALRKFIALCVSYLLTPAARCPTCTGEPFDALRDFLSAESVASPTSSGSANTFEEPITPENVRETLNAKNFTTYIPTSNRSVVSADGKFIREGESTKSLPPVQTVNPMKVTAPPVPAKVKAPAADVVTEERTKTKFQFTRAERAESAVSDRDVDDEDEMGSLNMDFMKNVSISAE